jgi:hypothetical protein
MLAPAADSASPGAFAATFGVLAGCVFAGADRSGGGADSAEAVSGAETPGCSPGAEIETAAGEDFSALSAASSSCGLAASDRGGVSPGDGVLAVSDEGTIGLPAPGCGAAASGAVPLSEAWRSSCRSAAANPITAANTTASAISGRGISNFLKSNGIAGSRRRFYCAGSAHSRDGETGLGRA